MRRWAPVLLPLLALPAMGGAPDPGLGAGSAVVEQVTQVIYANSPEFTATSTTCGIQEAIDSCGALTDGGCLIELPKGLCVPTDKITVGGLTSGTRKAGITIRGHGDGFRTTGVPGSVTAGTTIAYNGTPGPVFEVLGTRQFVLHGFTIDCDYLNDGNNQGTIGLDIRAKSSTSAIATRGSIRDMTIEDCSSVGVRFAGDTAPGTGVDTDQVDQMTIDRVLVKDSDTCYQIDSSNADAMHFKAAHCSDYGHYGFDFLQGDGVITGGIITTATAGADAGIRIADGVDHLVVTGEDMEIDVGEGIITTGTSRTETTVITGNNISLGDATLATEGTGTNCTGTQGCPDCLNFGHSGSLIFTGNTCYRRGALATASGNVDVVIDNGSGGTLYTQAYPNRFPSYVNKKFDRTTAADTWWQGGSNSDVHGAVYWGDQDNTSFDTGDEVCAARDLVCVNVLAMNADATETSEFHLVDFDCSTQVSNSDATTGGFFLALCR